MQSNILMSDPIFPFGHVCWLKEFILPSGI